jgi:hypothetical protein
MAVVLDVVVGAVVSGLVILFSVVEWVVGGNFGLFTSPPAFAGK